MSGMEFSETKKRLALFLKTYGKWNFLEGIVLQSWTYN